MIQMLSSGELNPGLPRCDAEAMTSGNTDHYTTEEEDLRRTSVVVVDG